MLIFSLIPCFRLIYQESNKWKLREIGPARRVGTKTRSFQLSDDEDEDGGGASPSRTFDSPEAIFRSLQQK